MTFRQDEYNLLLSDKRTAVSFSNTDVGNGKRNIIMDALIRPHSVLLNEKKTGIINPHRSMSNIPVEQIRACPRCDTDWYPLLHRHKPVADEYTTYLCENQCGVSMCADTYMRFVSNQRVAKVDIPSTTGDSMARVTETIPTPAPIPTLVFGGAIPEDAPPPARTLVFGGASQSNGHKTKEA